MGGTKQSETNATTTPSGVSDAPLPEVPTVPLLGPLPMFGAGKNPQGAASLFKDLFDDGPVSAGGRAPSKHLLDKEDLKPSLPGIIPAPGPLLPAHRAPRGFVSKPEPPPAAPKPATGVADDRLQWLREGAEWTTSKHLGVSGGLETSPFDLIAGLLKGVGAGFFASPSKGAAPIPAPRMTPGEEAAELEAAKEHIAKENLQSGIKEAVKGKKPAAADGGTAAE